MNNTDENALSEQEIFWFHEGTWLHSYRKMGAHHTVAGGIAGVRFNVWAPHAKAVGLACEHNGWDGSLHQLERVELSGIWTGFVPDLIDGDLYKYEIVTEAGEKLLKADPYAFYAEVRPATASIVWSLEGYNWGDSAWIKKRRSPYRQPMNIYEVHAGTWRKHQDGSLYTYTELADELIDYVIEMGYTHLELMPMTEHPYDRSWGYQPTGFFAPTSRYGEPQQLMAFIDRCHQKGIGVILDWVPGHFAKDAHGLRQFDGSAQYEHEDPLLSEKLVWGTLAFDYSKPEVRSFLISNALYWMEMFHIDGFRVDAVTSMLHRNFDKPDGQWRPNKHGGTENLEGIDFLHQLHSAVFSYYPHALMMAEESHAYPGVTLPVDQDGLGFNYKWNMGWMNDTLRYIALSFEERKGRQDLLTFPIWYAGQETHVLPLSHDEVVHGKRSLLNKMPGSYEQKFAGLRLLYGYMMTHPGKKLLFMGGEFGQFDEWKDEGELDFMLLGYEMHKKMQQYTKELNRLYLQEKSLWQLDHEPGGFQWIDHQDANQSVIVYRRLGSASGESVLVLCNFNERAHPAYRVGVPSEGNYRVLLSSDDPAYGGFGFEGGQLRRGTVHASERRLWHGKRHSVELPLPPLSIVILKRDKESRAKLDQRKGNVTIQAGEAE